MASGASLADDVSELKNRLNAVRKRSQSPVAAEGEAPQKPYKTYGRTPDGKVFVVPPTHDMLSTLLSPSSPKVLTDIIVLGIIALHFLALIALPTSALRINVLLSCFVFWRASYNVGIGVLLHWQSNHKALVYWARNSGVFDPKHPLYNLIKSEMTTKIGDSDYDFDNAPVEFNTWLLFRRLVDLILMCDFVSYSLFAIACMRVPAGESWGIGMGRWLGGLALIAFNAWVKLDAHRVVKDYAWYWGDFFFLIDQNLTFDGVFEMAPHPMYSVGYAGYYGLSLISASYTVLFVSLLAHAAQFAFLTIVENPHIDKIYNSPPPKPRRSTSATSVRPQTPIRPESADGQSSGIMSPISSVLVTTDEELPPKTRPVVGKPDLFRQTDLTTLLLIAYTIILTALTSNSTLTKTLFIIHAGLWRLWHTAGIGSVLVKQSRSKAWIRHFVKVGEGRIEAWREWRGLYHISLVGCWASFFAAGWKCYMAPESWGYGNGFALLTHTIGLMLISLQVWTSVSIYESLGEFGWFYGDFFFDQQPKLTYSGIYRYLNNPERLIGSAALWGMVLITGSSPLFLLALFSHVCILLFIQLVERPHMEKLYGKQIRREAGLVRTIKRAMPPPVVQHVGRLEKRVDRVLADTQDLIEDFLIQVGPRFENGVAGFVKDTRFMFSQYPARLSITKLADDLKDYDMSQYKLEILNAKSKTPESTPVDTTGNAETFVIGYGEPIRVKWTAAKNHSKKDWVGLYRVADNHSRTFTRVASMGRWVGVCKDQHDSEQAQIGLVTSDVITRNEDGEEVATGEVVFEADKTFWVEGSYEFRYHHDGKHSVMAISAPFEIVVPKVSDLPLPTTDDHHDHTLSNTSWTSDAVMSSVESRLLPVVQNCFDRDESKGSPWSVDDEFGFGAAGRDGEKYACRVVYAVKNMFGVDFAPDVVQADGNVKRLSWRICNARKVLAPFSMSSTGNSTPGTPRY
ncbi:phospholipid methyltransferase-domain-containing protein [Peziza echinospora]|nr:phospholipid methyltransferase-domain-containing protein [Peziza echinospora]